ncbi:MAG: hypothetical protein AVDCRST_MAG69-2560 [uncultured Solirubrobacteraceae bacterium]|uniref:DUF2254 domain-containing protein n=1 Tax=uncultured Solirubrobacteraceae bacterium TaxID=1162706 RepID=A0A6J4T2H9_9ACTN|nr:MAG: hypothetical protein AVDCRST_MAG69-2560 [uncultured Solirubrobacteraceae bacterium]
MGALIRRFPVSLDALRQSFWALPGVGISLGVLVGYFLVEIDYSHELAPGIFNFVDLQSARAVLQTIATVTVSVIGLSFSVILVALQLASQQLSPRVLRTFQGDRLVQSVLAVFIGTFMYCLVVLAKLREDGVPALSISVGVLSAIVAFVLFVAFIHHIVVSLKPSTLIKRIGADGRWVIEQRWPQAGGETDVSRRAVLWAAGDDGVAVPARQAGFVSAIDVDGLIRMGAKRRLSIVQRAEIGDYVLTGAVLATLHGDRDMATEAADDVRGRFTLAPERSLVGDVGFPIRQLADIALRGLSPSLNDPTTAENALDMLADLLIRFAAEDPVEPVRADAEGEPRFVASVPDLGDLVRLGFEQVRVAAAGHPVIARRMIGRLEEVARTAHDHGWDLDEIRRQQGLIRNATAGEVPNDEDARAVRVFDADTDPA